MIIRLFCVGLFVPAGVSGFLGCAPEEDPLAAPLVTVVRDLATVWDQGVFCVSPYEWYSQIKRHPPEVLEGIAEEGFTFWIGWKSFRTPQQMFSPCPGPSVIPWGFASPRK